MSIDPRTRMGKVALTVRDVDRVRSFYEQTVGLSAIASSEDHAILGAGDEPLVELVGDPGATPRTRRTTGLYHLAILVPDRLELARTLHRLIEARGPLAGAADHLVSEAVYLEDPEGNGIEIYRDRPRGQWRRDGDEIAMATLPLDLQDVLREDVEPAGAEGMATGARMGHVHLQVADLREAERFYGDLLGFDVTARGYPGALFMSAGGYHHHLGLNVWAGEGAPPPPPRSTGLRSYEVVVPDLLELDRTVERLTESGTRMERDGGAVVSQDPARNTVVFRVAT